MTGDTYTGPAAGQYGNHNQQYNTFYSPPRTPARWPHQVGVIPGRAQSFQHRAEVGRLRQALAGGGTAVVGQVLAGMGGVGKTQLAADYARHAQETGAADVLVWITADNNTAAASGYGQAGVEVLGADPADPQAAARAFLAWLEPKAAAEPCRWLIVLDDVADPADLAGWWPPASPHGRTLVTTRRRDAALTGNSRRLIEVGLFTQAEAVAYLTDVLAAHKRTEPDDQLGALAVDLGYLPLALSQAAAYLVDVHLTCAEYRDLLADRATTLADAAPDALPDDQTVTLAAAWSLSIDRADTLRPAGLARPMLQLTAFLDANGIPETVLTSSPALAHLTAHRTPIDESNPRENGPARDRDAVGALRALHRLHLIEHTPDTPHQMVRVHQLVQRTVRDALTPGRHDQTARIAADALVAAWPEVERDTALAQALRANADALTHHAADALYQPCAHHVLLRAGTSLGDTGHVAAAITHFQHIHTAAHNHLGSEHPDTLAFRAHLADWMGEAGDATGAAAAFEKILADWLRVLDPEHPEVLGFRATLARWRGEAGDAKGAAAALEELLADRIQVLGPDHRDILTIRNNLYRWRGKAGHADRAAADFESLATDCIRVLGPKDPYTLAARYNHYQWRGEAGDAEGAAAALEELLADRIQVLGPDHRGALTTRHTLATMRGRAGDAGRAAADFAELLEDRQRIQDPDHPETLATQNALAYWQRRAYEMGSSGG
ncbi:tetratricopeptide repeat protein [Streptomyces mirabilis]